MPTRPADWDAETYDRVSSLQEDWARQILAGLTLRGDETVLDAGSGSGRVTRLLLDRVPRGRVIGVDASPSMVEHARAALGDEATFLASDLVELTRAVLKAEAGATAVEVIFSNATFHWIPDHEALFRRLHDLLVPGGRLVAQCAAEGNVPEYNAAIRDAGREPPFAPHLAGWEGPFNFASAADTESRLRAAGFDPVACEVIRFDTTLDDPRGFIMASGLAPHFERLPEELHEPFADAVLSRLGDPVILHYVRLNIDARRPA